jgi:hypothetical protein
LEDSNALPTQRVSLLNFKKYAQKFRAQTAERNFDLVIIGSTVRPSKGNFLRTYEPLACPSDRQAAERT